MLEQKKTLSLVAGVLLLLLLAVGLDLLGVVRTVVEAALEQLDGDDSEDELEQHVDDHDVEHVLERVHDTVEHRLMSTAEQRRGRD